MAGEKRDREKEGYMVVMMMMIAMKFHFSTVKKNIASAELRNCVTDKGKTKVVKPYKRFQSQGHLK